MISIIWSLLFFIFANFWPITVSIIVKKWWMQTHISYFLICITNTHLFNGCNMRRCTHFLFGVYKLIINKIAKSRNGNVCAGGLGWRCRMFYLFTQNQFCFYTHTLFDPYFFLHFFSRYSITHFSNGIECKRSFIRFFCNSIRETNTRLSL